MVFWAIVFLPGFLLTSSTWFSALLGNCCFGSPSFSPFVTTLALHNSNFRSNVSATSTLRQFVPHGGPFVFTQADFTFHPPPCGRTCSSNVALVHYFYLHSGHKRPSLAPEVSNFCFVSSGHFKDTLEVTFQGNAEPNSDDKIEEVENLWNHYFNKFTQTLHTSFSLLNVEALLRNCRMEKMQEKCTLKSVQSFLDKLEDIITD
ncbi:hypothetical protein TNCV_4142801 [Trichonephila clavipes]|nr:hypothetical protein TNCV_4142801 [Trichonephila clavipes]